jgi:hypothetical protein
MTDRKNLALLAALTGAALLSCLSASSALAGGKAGWGFIWDPVSHAPATGDVIHIYSFRRLEQVTGGFNSTSNVYEGRGVLKNRCDIGGTWKWCGTNVDYKLTNSAPHGSCGWGWSRLYVRSTGSTDWRELPHYAASVTADCS